jgi:hypothetical protein
MKREFTMRRFGRLTLLLLALASTLGCDVLDVLKVMYRLGDSGGSGWSSGSGGLTSFDLYEYDLRP